MSFLTRGIEYPFLCHFPLTNLFDNAALDHIRLIDIKLQLFQIYTQQNFSGSNTDGSFTTAVSNSSSSPLEQNPIAAD